MQTALKAVLGEATDAKTNLYAECWLAADPAGCCSQPPLHDYSFVIVSSRFNSRFPMSV